MKYRKKPLVVDAIQFTGHEEDEEELAKFLAGREWALIDFGKTLLFRAYGEPVRAEAGDFVVKDINGEPYPCKKEVFERSYERIPANEAAEDWVQTELSL